MKFIIVHETSDLLEFMLIQFYYIILFSMRLITITLHVDTMVELDKKLVGYFRTAKCAFVLYNVIYILKLSLEGIVDSFS